MLNRWPILFAAVLLASAPVTAKNKKKQVLPDYILNAQTVFVVITPDAGEPITEPMANRTAEEDVEKAIMKWGRFKIVADSQIADLIIAVRRGHNAGPVIRNSPADNRPVIVQSTDGNARIGVHQGRPPDLNDPGPGGPTDRGPAIANEVGSSEDALEVYMGRIQYPLDASPLWRYMGKDSLKAPRVEAVEQFRKAIDESEKQRQHKP
ncbi:MAG TPA: hypothetical protein VH596_06225 [Terriglobales bacterium]|jgi:hypothetical protein